jgi:hypothetical protein
MVKMSEDFVSRQRIVAPIELKYEVEEDKELLYSDEFRNLLDARYSDYRNGIEMISAAESYEKIQIRLASEK